MHERTHPTNRVHNCTGRSVETQCLPTRMKLDGARLGSHGFERQRMGSSWFDGVEWVRLGSSGSEGVGWGCVGWEKVG
eukprot:8741687-Lingulodinium_polyedra.AAC.1